MPAELRAILGLQNGNLGAVELVQPRIGVDVDLLELDPEPAQRPCHFFAQMAVGAPEKLNLALHREILAVPNLYRLVR
jgi:hypothetical protein